MQAAGATDTLDNVLEKLLLNLQTVASIPKGKRIATTREFINIEQESFWQGIYRMSHGDSRDKAVTSIQNLIDTLIAYMELIMESRHLCSEAQTSEAAACDIPIAGLEAISARDKRIGWLKKINAGFSEAITGISNLCETYADDTNVVGRLTPTIKKISTQVARLTRLLIDIGEYTDPQRKKF